MQKIRPAFQRARYIYVSVLDPIRPAACATLTRNSVVFRIFTRQVLNTNIIVSVKYYIQAYHKPRRQAVYCTRHPDKNSQYSSQGQPWHWMEWEIRQTITLDKSYNSMWIINR